MYDSRQEAHEFFADRADEAIQKACQFFGVETDALSIHEMPGGEVYGAAGRAVIVAALLDRAPAARSDRPDRGSERGGGDRPDRPRRERGRGRDRERSDRGGRGDAGGRGGRGDREREQAAAPLPPSEPVGPSVGKATGTLGDLGEFVLGLFERMDLGPFEISEADEGELVVLEVRGPAAAQLAGGDGRAVDAIQLLANQVAIQLSEERRRVVVDVEGKSQVTEEMLEKLARRAADRATETSRVVALDPMNPRDRRIVHLALREDEGVATSSVGEGRYRQVLVVPEGAPEYEEARREAENAARQED